MTSEEILASGLLELYVVGALSQREAQMVEDALLDYPNLKKEIEEIEYSLMQLSIKDMDAIPQNIWNRIQASIKDIGQQKVKRKGTDLPSKIGWAAAILLLGGIVYLFNQQVSLKDEMQQKITDNNQLHQELEVKSDSLLATQELLEIIRSNTIKTIPLPGNPAVAPSAFAKVYYNLEGALAYVDIKGLPTPPEGQVYQVWSLLMDPLTPTSIGVLSDYETNDTKVFKLENIPSSEAFGITLEPDGGSEAPTLTQLYVLGSVAP